MQIGSCEPTLKARSHDAICNNNFLHTGNLLHTGEPHCVNAKLAPTLAEETRLSLQVIPASHFYKSYRVSGPL